MGSLVLDFLLIIVFLMMTPIGFYRGGVRELCVSAGLMLGILMSQSWGARWGVVFERMFGMNEGSAAFLMSVVITFSITGLIGYGGSAAFAWRPGPGGRLYGAYLALFNAMVVAGYLINLYGLYIVPSLDGDPVTDGIISRALSQGFGYVLLIATIGVGIATIFGMFVRDRAEDSPSWQPPAPQLYQPTSTTRPYRVEESEPVQRTSSEPVRILEVKEWESQAEEPRPDPSTYGSGWRQTWPDGSPAKQRNTRSAGRTRPTSSEASRSEDTSESRNVLADWMKDQDQS